jgi:hypothetical protein
VQSGCVGIRIGRRAQVITFCLLASSCTASQTTARSASTTQTPPLPSTTTTTTTFPPDPALTTFARRTAQGVSITFSMNTRDPLIKAYRAKLKRASAVEVSEGRNPVSPECLPRLAYRETATWGATRATIASPAVGVATKIPRSGSDARYTPDNRHRILLVVVRTADPRVATLEIESDGRIDRQRPISGWAALALVAPVVGTPLGEAVPFVFAARAANGSVTARVKSDQESNGDPCLPPFRPLT